MKKHLTFNLWSSSNYFISLFCSSSHHPITPLLIGPGPQGNNVPNYQPQVYPGYPQGAHAFRPPPGLYNPNSSAYYGAPSVMVSPGGGYIRPHGSYYPRSEYVDPSYGPYPGQGYQHPMYAAEMHNRNNFDPRSQMGYPSQPTGMDFSRAVSSSFGDNNSKSSTDKGRNNEKASTDDSLPNFDNYYKSSDNRSIASEKSDTSWKLLNQVASIEEEKFRSAEDSRLDTTSPIGDQSKNPHNIMMKDCLNSTNQALTSLSSVASMQEPLDTSNSKDELDLIQCASSGSLFFNTHDDSFVKRGREEREDAEDDARGRDDDEIRRGPSSSPPNVANLSMRDKSDIARPQKKRRENINDDYYDQPPSYTFSLESAPSFSKDQQYQSLPNLSEKPRPPSMLEPFDTQKDKNDIEWEIKDQDSFGANFSIGSNMSVHENVDDGPLITSSFSFGKEVNNENDDFGGKLNGFDRSQHNRNILENSNKTSHGKYPPHSATWVTNTSSFNGNKPEAHRQSNLYHPVPTNPAQSFNSSSSMQSSHRMMPKHHHDMMRAFSHDSGSSSPATSGMHPHIHSHYGPLHGPYGAPLPPHIPQSDSHLPPSFRPPSNIHPHMARPPQTVYMMSNPTGGRQSVVRNASMDSSVNKANAGGVYSWTKSDDARLTEIMKKFKNPKDWEPVAEEFGGGKS